jgi:hypothetical protein
MRFTSAVATRTATQIIVKSTAIFIHHDTTEIHRGPGWIHPLFKENRWHIFAERNGVSRKRCSADADNIA